MAEVDRRLYAALYGPTTGDRVRLGDTALEVVVESDETSYGDEVLGGCAKTLRDGMLATSRPGDSQLDLLISNVVVLDPVLGVRKANVGVKDGRIVGVGRAGNPDVVDDVDLVIGSHTALVPGEGLIATAGAIDSHVHLSSPGIMAVALASGVTTMVGMGLGGVWDVGVNPARNVARMLEAWRAFPINVSFLARGSASHPAILEEGLEAGASGFKVHEDFAAYPAVIDTCLAVAEAADVAVAIHTDSLNESGMLTDTVAATAGRTVHAYHVEGGGGHPNLLEILSQPHVVGSSTTPTVPLSVNTEHELFPMTMTVHRQSALLPSDVEVSRSRIRRSTMEAENVLHDSGTISIVNSDSMGMGRAGEMVRRTWQLASLMKERSGDGLSPGADNERVLRYLAKLTINPAIVHGLAHEVGSLEPGKLADVVLWQPAWFGTKPELVLKAGFVAHGVSGGGDGSTRLGQPRRYRPFFGGLGAAPQALSTIFASQAALDAGLAARLPGARLSPVSATRGITRARMVRNTAVPAITVPLDGTPVLVDGHPVTLEPATRVPLGQLHHFA